MRVSDLKRKLETFNDDDFILVSLSSFEDVKKAIVENWGNVNDNEALLVLLYTQSQLGNHEEEIERALDDLFSYKSAALRERLCYAYSIPLVN